MNTLKRLLRACAAPIAAAMLLVAWPVQAKADVIDDIAWVLNDPTKLERHRFLVQQGRDLSLLFPGGLADRLKDRRWRVNDDAFETIDSFAGILARAPS